MGDSTTGRVDAAVDEIAAGGEGSRLTPADLIADEHLDPAMASIFSDVRRIVEEEATRGNSWARQAFLPAHLRASSRDQVSYVQINPDELYTTVQVRELFGLLSSHSGATFALPENLDDYPDGQWSYERIVAAARAFNTGNVHVRDDSMMSLADYDPTEPGAIPETAESARLPDDPTITVNVITRDGLSGDGRDVVRALVSCASFASRMVVVDTGTADDEKREIRAQLAARLPATIEITWLESPWQADFGLHRNEALAVTGGDWLFWIDDDEEVPPSTQDRVLALTRLGHEIVFGLPVIGPMIPSAIYQSRLIPRIQELTWQFAVHEQILPSCQHLRRMPILEPIWHWGYTSPARQEVSARRNESIADAHGESPADDGRQSTGGSLTVLRLMHGDTGTGQGDGTGFVDAIPDESSAQAGGGAAEATAPA